MFDAGGFLYEFDYLNHVGQPIVFLQGLLIFIATGFIAFKVSKSFILSILIALFKSLIFTIYFYFFYNAGYHFYDDVIYYTVSREQFESFGIFQIFTKIDDAQRLIGTNHISYWIFVYLSGKLFGFYYFSAVFANILLSLLSSYLIYLTLIRTNFSKQFSSLFFLFILVHWDTIAWTSFISTKEQLVHFTIVLTFYNLVLIKQSKKISILNLLFIALALIIVSQIRTYMLIFLLVIFSIYVIFLLKLPNQRIYRLFLYILPTLIIPYFIYVNFEPIYISLSKAYLLMNVDFENLSLQETLYGIIKYIVTPNPLNIAPNYGFYFIPSILNIFSIPFVLLGSTMVFDRRNTPLICYFILFITVVIFYALFPEIQGARQRYQISMVLIFLQFLSIFRLFTRGKVYS
jgi:hypothetical protein